MRVLRFGAGYASYGIRIFQGCYAVNSVIRWLRLHKWTYRRTWYFYPLRLMGMMTDRWHNYWLQTQIGRWPWFGPGVKNVQVRKLTRSPYHQGMSLVVGGHRLRGPGVIGFRGNTLEHTLPDTVLEVAANVLWAFATGKLTVFGAPI